MFSVPYRHSIRIALWTRFVVDGCAEWLIAGRKRAHAMLAPMLSETPAHLTFRKSPMVNVTGLCGPTIVEAKRLGTAVVILWFLCHVYLSIVVKESGLP
jgi:hypothetical protein